MPELGCLAVDVERATTKEKVRKERDVVKEKERTKERRVKARLKLDPTSVQSALDMGIGSRECPRRMEVNQVQQQPAPGQPEFVPYTGQAFQTSWTTSTFTTA